MERNSTIGITGGIGSGKSVVSRVLRCNGFPVMDCDAEAKYLMSSDERIRKSLQTRLGKDIYLESGQLNRSKLAALLFTNNEIRQFVNNIVHEAVRFSIRKKRKETQGYLFIESAILASGGIVEMCDQIWIIRAPENIRIERIKKRDNLTIEEIHKRMETQKSELDFLDPAKTIWLENNDQEPLLVEILSLTDKLIKNQTYLLTC